MHYNYLIVGAGLFGATFANLAHKAGKSILVIDKRNHIAGNCYTESILKHLTSNGILAVFHYGRFCGEDKYTTKESDHLFRLPMFYGLKEEEREEVCNRIFEFFGV